MFGQFNLKKNKKILVYAVIGAAGIIFIGRFLISELKNYLEKPKKMIRVEENRLILNLAMEKAKDVIVANYKVARPAIEQKFSGERQIVAALLGEMENAVKESNGTIISLSPREIQEQTEGPNQYIADFRIEISFPAFLEFLSKIQKSKMLIKIDEFSMQGKNEEADVLRVEGIISMTVI